MFMLANFRALSSSDRQRVLKVLKRIAADAAKLASSYPTVSIRAENQAVVDGASALILCLRPQDAKAVLDNLIFSDGQVIISAIMSTAIADCLLSRKVSLERKRVARARSMTTIASVRSRRSLSMSRQPHDGNKENY
jgi:pyrroline-5-carboxylate reductase